MAKAPVSKGGTLVPTRVDRIAKRVKTDIVSVKMASIPHTISVQAAQIVEVPGFILDANKDTVTLRHRARAASSKQIITRYARANIIELLGAAGGPGQVMVRQNVELRRLPGQLVRFEGDVIIATDAKSGEVTEFRQTANAVVTVIAEDVKPGDGAKAGKDKKPAKAEADKKPAGKKGGKKSDFAD
jgi:hypothetical protein